MSLHHYSYNSTYLELLPPELQRQILKNVPDIETLRALIRASPRYFQVYRTSRKMILSHVVWNQITPVIVPIALNALERRDLKKLRSNRTGPFTFKRTLKEPYEIPFKTWEKLLRFHEIVEYFISNFIISRLVTLENSLHPQNSRQLGLSRLEYARLARAFYNLELYGNIFHDLDTSMERASTFLQSLQDWELEELLCVRSYMMDRLKDYLNKFEDDFMETFQKDVPYIIWPPEDIPRWNSRRELLSDEGYDWLQVQWIEGCLTRGLVILSEMFSAVTLADKFKVLGVREFLGKYMSQALNHMPICSRLELAAKMKPPEIGFYDNIDQPNEAWFWAMKFRGHPRVWPQEYRKRYALEGWDNDEFEGWGYVIWDHERLKRLGILTKTPWDILADTGMDWRIERTPISLEARTRRQEEIWSREGCISTLTEPRPMFDWQNPFRSDSALHQ